MPCIYCIKLELKLELELALELELELKPKLKLIKAYPTSLPLPLSYAPQRVYRRHFSF